MRYNSGFSKIKLSISIPLAYKGAGIALFRQENNQTYVLLGKRKFSPGKGKWTFPGGGFDSPDKTLDKTACREFYEETNRKVSEFSPLKVGVREFNFGVWKWKTLILKATSFPKTSRVPKKYYHEFSEIKWVNVGNLKKYELHFGVIEVVKDFFLKNKPKLPKFKDLFSPSVFSYTSYYDSYYDPVTYGAKRTDYAPLKKPKGWV